MRWCVPGSAISLLACSGLWNPEPDKVPASASPAAPVAAVASSGAACDNPFMPVREGLKWTYASSVLGDEFTQVVSDVTAAGFTVTQTFPQSTQVFRWECRPNGLAQAEYDFGRSPLSSRFVLEAMTAEGVSVPRDLKAGSNWTMSYSAKARSTMAKAPQIQMDATVGAQYRAVGRESVTVPAGTFDALRVDVDIDQTFALGGGLPVSASQSAKTTGSLWFVEGMSFVKAQFETTIPNQPAIVKDVTELKSFAP